MRRLLLLLVLLVGLPTLGWPVQDTATNVSLYSSPEYKLWQALRCDGSGNISSLRPEIDGITCDSNTWSTPMFCGGRKYWLASVMNLSTTDSIATVFGCYEVIGAAGYPGNKKGVQSSVDDVGDNDPLVELTSDTTAGSACVDLSGVDPDAADTTTLIDTLTAGAANETASLVSAGVSVGYPWYIIDITTCSTCNAIYYFSCWD